MTSRYDKCKMVEEKTAQVQPEIFEYIRRRKGGNTHKIGVIYGTTDGDTIKIGWSKCNVKEGDNFDADVGFEIAKERALVPEPDDIAVPLCLKQHIRQFGARCVRYFKEANKLELPV